MAYHQGSPFAVQIELVEGCPLRCSFCGLNGIRGKDNDYKAMKPEALRSIMRQIHKAGWNPRVEFAMHGEPSMHPEFVNMVGIARSAAPSLQLMMTSNGAGFLKKPGPFENVKGVFENGLSVLALDDYDGVKFVEKIVGALIEREREFDELGILVYQYPKEPKGNPHVRRPKHERIISIVKDISAATKGTHSTLNNHAGAGAPLDYSLDGKRCAKPFRELSIRWDGSVAICCNDWRGVYKCGNVLEEGVLEVWNNARFRAARRKLYHGMRDFGPCKGCNAKSYRTGLLPDKLGKQHLKKPTESDLRVIEAACAGKPYTAPVLRPWEKKA